jgi:single-strand DNA-binding protein
MGAAQGSATAREKRRKNAAEATSDDGSEEVGPVRLNLVVVRGTCSGPPELRELESGRRLAALAVRAPGPDGRTTSVPVTVWEPAAWVEDLDDGVEVVVVGAVRRRFFRTSAGGAGARVDVEAVFVGRAGSRRDLDAARRRTDEVLAGLLE